MYYNVDIGKLRAKSYVTQGSVIHELRHYGSLVTSFKTREAKTDVFNIIKEHYCTLVLKYAMKEPGKRFCLTQLGVDIADLYLTMTGHDIERLTSDNGYTLNVRGFADQWSVLPNVGDLPIKPVAAGVRIELGTIVLYASFETDCCQIRKKIKLPARLELQLKAAPISKYLLESTPVEKLIAMYS